MIKFTIKIVTPMDLWDRFKGWLMQARQDDCKGYVTQYREFIKEDFINSLDSNANQDLSEYRERIIQILDISLKDSERDIDNMIMRIQPKI